MCFMEFVENPPPGRGSFHYQGVVSRAVESKFGHTASVRGPKVSTAGAPTRDERFEFLLKHGKA